MQGSTPIGGRRAAAAFAVAAIAAFAALAARAADTASAGSEPFQAVPLAETFNEPVYTDNAQGFDDLLFVVEREGEIEVLVDEVKQPQPFLDIKDRVDTTGEGGLLSVAFALDYKKTRRFYVFYTDNNGDIRVDEFKRRKGNRLRASEDSRRRVIRIPHPGASNHNGATVTFGIKGSVRNPDQAPKLWIGTGDGGNSANARDVTDNLLGKILRIDAYKRDNPSAPGYDIPQNNRFVGKPGDDEIYAYGLRNPYRFSFDHERKAIAIGDVGGGVQEEINYYDIIPNRGSYLGWPQFEGTFEHGGPDPTPYEDDPPKPPMYSYPHGTGLAAVTGGVVIRDPDLPALDGTYVFADVYDGDLLTFVPDLAANAPVNPPADSGEDVASPVAFTTGANKQVYVTSLAGSVYKLEPPP